MTTQEQLQKLQQLPEVEKVDVYPGIRYVVHYEDGSASFLDVEGKSIRTPMRDYDVVRNFMYLGDYNNVPHFAFKGTNFETKMHSVTHIFDVDGREKLFKDPRLNALESVFEIKNQFDRLKLEARDFLLEVGNRQSHSLRR